MKTKVRIMSVMLYEDKQTLEEKTRVGFYFSDEQNIQRSEKFKGYSEIAFYLPRNVFDRIPIGIIGHDVIAITEEKTNPMNPFKKSIELVGFETKNGVIDLL